MGRRNRPVAGESLALAKERCRRRTSFAGAETQRPFANGVGGNEQRFADVISFEVRVQGENILGFCRSATSATRDSNPKSADLNFRIEARDGVGAVTPLLPRHLS